MFGIDLNAILAFLGTLVVAIGWGGWQKHRRTTAENERDQARQETQQAELRAKAERQGRDIAQRMRESEGDNEARDHRIRNPNDFG